MSGMTKEVNPEHPPNIVLPKFITVDGIVNEVNPVHPRNVLSPIFTINEGIVNDVILEQLANI